MGKRVDQILGNLPLEHKPEAILAFLEREVRPILSRLRESNNELVETDLTDLEAAVDALETSVAGLGAELDAMSVMEPYDIPGTTHTVSATDINRYGRTSNAGAVTITVNASHGMTAGQVAHYRQGAAGQITFSPSGVTVNISDTYKSRLQGSNLMLICVSATELDLTGDVELA